MRKLSTQRSPQVWKAVVESCCVSGSLGCTAASYVSCHLCQLGACGKHLQSRGYFPTAEKSGMSSQGAARTKEGGWAAWARSVCTTIPKLGTWKAREIHLVVIPKTIVLFPHAQLLLCNPKSSIKRPATVSPEMLCSCKGGCLSNVSLVSKTPQEPNYAVAGQIPEQVQLCMGEPSWLGEVFLCCLALGMSHMQKTSSPSVTACLGEQDFCK